MPFREWNCDVKTGLRYIISDSVDWIIGLSKHFTCIFFKINDIQVYTKERAFFTRFMLYILRESVWVLEFLNSKSLIFCPIMRKPMWECKKCLAVYGKWNVTKHGYVFMKSLLHVRWIQLAPSRLISNINFTTENLIMNN